MTIDEAIKREKEKSEHAKEEYLMLQDDNWTDIETYEKRLNNCANFAEYHEQLAKLLEELKAIKENAVFYSSRPIEDIVLEARADAIDEIREPLKKAFDENMMRCEGAHYSDYWIDCFLDNFKDQNKEQK